MEAILYTTSSNTQQGPPPPPSPPPGPGDIFCTFRVQAQHLSFIENMRTKRVQNIALQSMPSHTDLQALFQDLSFDTSPTQV